jgi:hypothetical protein
MREARHPLSSGIVQLIFHGMIESTTSKILQQGPGGFIITRKWTHQFMKQYMNWFFRMDTTTTNNYHLTGLNKDATWLIK